jgi:hypothetical protein
VKDRKTPVVTQTTDIGKETEQKAVDRTQRCRIHTKYERFEVCNYDGTILRSNEISLPKKNMLDLLLYKTYFIGQ